MSSKCYAKSYVFNELWKKEVPVYVRDLHLKGPYSMRECVKQLITKHMLYNSQLNIQRR